MYGKLLGVYGTKAELRRAQTKFHAGFFAMAVQMEE
jgi:hypothetical protein